MYTLAFATLFTANFALALYLVANERSHAQPWRFFLAALLTILVAYGIEVGASIVRIPAKPDPLMEHLVKLTNLVSAVFAGALASTAITNRAKLRHDVATRALLEQLRSLDDQAAQLISNLRSELAASLSDPGDITLRTNRTAAITRLLDGLDQRRQAVRTKLVALEPPAITPAQRPRASAA